MLCLEWEENRREGSREHKQYVVQLCHVYCSGRPVSDSPIVSAMRIDKGVVDNITQLRSVASADKNTIGWMVSQSGSRTMSHLHF